MEEQIELLRRLWTEETVDFRGKWDAVEGAGINPLPVQRPVPIWIGASSVPPTRIRERIGRQADGWFVLCSPEQLPEIKSDIDRAAQSAGRDPDEIGMEAGVAVVGPREAEWKDRVSGWRRIGLTHLCLRTLGGGLDGDRHLEKMREVLDEIPA